MYVFLGLSGVRSRNIVAVACNPVDKTDNDAVVRALNWQADYSDISVVEIWDETKNEFVCRVEV